MKKYIPYIISLKLFIACNLQGNESTKTINLFQQPQIANKAENYIGKYYKPGVSAQCAAFVGHIVSACGYNVPQNHAKCTSWTRWGRTVNISSLKRGDIIIYSRNSSGYNHIGIYDGSGHIIHRPTRSSPVRKLNYKYRSIISIRRPSR